MGQPDGHSHKSTIDRGATARFVLSQPEGQRILYLDHAPVLGGAEVVLLNLLRHLDGERYQPVVVTSDNPAMLKRLRGSQVPTEVIPFGQINIRSPRLLWRLGRSARAVARIIRRRRIDLIHSNTVRAHIVGALAAWITGTPLIWTLHDNTFSPPLVRVLSRIPRRVIAVSHYVASLYQPAYLDPAKCCVIYNGLPDKLTPADPCRVRDELALAPGTPLVVNVGRLIPGKGQALFIEAALRVLKQIPVARFVLVGGPNPSDAASQRYADELHRQIEAADPSQRVLMAGRRDDVANFYAAADVVVYSAVSPEGLPTVLLEAMAQGRPVVASALGGATEVVEDERTGILVPAGDVEALADAIRRLLLDRELAQAMGQAGRARVRSHFNLADSVRQVQEVYRSVLAENGGS